MPTYEYVCDACGHRFEQFQRMTDRPVKKCPQCGKASVRRLISSGAGIIFKGSGFYQTDYRSKSYAESAKKETPAPSAGAAPTPSSSKKEPPAPAKTKKKEK